MKHTNQLEFEAFIDDGELGSEDGKFCNKCNQLLPLTAFSAHSGANYLRPECRSCNQELTRVRTELRQKHGMPSEGYCCPICKGDEEGVKGKGNTRNGSWVLDHCHDTDSFRGWLCHKCNRALGGFNDDISLLQNAIEYLKGKLK
jgi:hypothetical protein